MRRAILALFILISLASPARGLDLTLPADTPAEFYFSPRGGVTDALARHIAEAKESILVLAYSFTSRPLAEALIQAAGRGVRVSAILDRGQRRAKGGQGQALADGGAQVFVDTEHAIAHNKVLIIDDRLVSTGSFNFTQAAEQKNAENVVLLDAPEVARLYREEWDKLREQAEPW